VGKWKANSQEKWDRECGFVFSDDYGDRRAQEKFAQVGRVAFSFSR
jgi:hypothetical protein